MFHSDCSTVLCYFSLKLFPGYMLFFIRMASFCFDQKCKMNVFLGLSFFFIHKFLVNLNILIKCILIKKACMLKVLLKIILPASYYYSCNFFLTQQAKLQKKQYGGVYFRVYSIA